MQAEILMIGTELLLGQIEDTNATHISRVLAENGVNLYQKTTVGDNRARIVGALTNALNRSDVVLCSGGLGPTADDITRECVAEVLDRPLEYHEEIFERIAAMFARYRLRITENNKKQAMVPRGASILENPFGTAPGILIDDERGIVACMPGVPRELEAMLANHIVPYLRDRFGLADVIHYRVLKVCGVGESRVDDAIGDLIDSQENPTVGVLANPRAVRIRIAARAPNRAAAETLIQPVEQQIRQRLPGLIMGIDDDSLEKVLDNLLADRGLTLGVVETATGGLIAQRLVTEGARRFAGSRVYPPESIEPNDVDQTARELAQRFMQECGASCVAAVVADLATGTTAIAFAHPDGVENWSFGRSGTSELLQLRAGTVVLEFIRRFLLHGRVDLRPEVPARDSA